jgi:hypothetical protein
MDCYGTAAAELSGYRSTLAWAEDGRQVRLGLQLTPGMQ